MFSQKQQGVYDLLKGIESGDPDSVKVVNEAKYIQHNPQTREGGVGLAELFAELAKTNPKVEIVRLFEDGDYVFGHTIYDFSSVRVGFEVFRYEGDQIVEHWDNIQSLAGDMVAGSTKVTDLDLTEQNRDLIAEFSHKTMILDLGQVEDYLGFNYREHSSFTDIHTKAKDLEYTVNHRLLANGNFVLAVNEGYDNGVHSSFYDLFRIEAGKIVEHWDTTEKIPPQDTWLNQNGKF